ncbi:MAG: riboflavin synthase [Candidatus Omnitrophica bacterium]|nr:riboflavin synthase [Candidatus Omnitrophota bacterium]
MFSGIIEELGRVKSIVRRGNNTLLEISMNTVSQDTAVSESISVNGACLTVIEKKDGSLFFEVMPETLRLSNLGCLKAGDQVNLERSLKVGDRISGHFVTGHVDCLGLIRKKSLVNNNLCFEIAVPPEFLKHCLSKGSIAVDGISLTIANARAGAVSVYIIPHTLKNTTLGFKGPSDKVNIEFDILAKRR